MTPFIKRCYLTGMIIIFIITVPVLVLYSSGYRLNGKFRLVKTGGIYLDNNESGISVKINGKLKKNSGMFENDILISDLVPAVYYIRVEKRGYRPWKKNVTVHEQKVENCYPLLIPSEFKPHMISKWTTINPGKKTRKIKYVPNVDYAYILEIFSTYNKPSKSIIPGWQGSEIKKLRLGSDRKLFKKVFLFRAGKSIYVKWRGRDEQRPFFIDSSDRKQIYTSEKNIKEFGFFPGRKDSMMVLTDDGILSAVEIDTRYEIQNIYQITKDCNRFAVKDEMLYYFSANKLYSIDFEP